MTTSPPNVLNLTWRSPPGQTQAPNPGADPVARRHGLGVFWLVWILWKPCAWAWAWSLTLFTEMTPPPNEAGRPGQCHLWLA